MRMVLIISFLLFMTGCGAVRPAILNRAFSDDVEGARKLVTTGHLKQAIDELTLLIDMDPKNSEARILRGVAYQGLEEFDLAVKDLEAVIVIHPGNPKAHYNLGMMFAYKLHDTRHALEHFDRFLSLAPDHTKAFAVAKVMCSLDTSQGGSENNALPGILKEAAAMTDSGGRRKKLSEIAQMNSGSPIPLYLIGKSYEEDGRNDEAMKSYREAIEKRPTCAPCHYSLGRLLILKKKADEGRAHLAKAKLFDPNSSEGDVEVE